MISKGFQLKLCKKLSAGWSEHCSIETDPCSPEASVRAGRARGGQFLQEETSQGGAGEGEGEGSKEELCVHSRLLTVLLTDWEVPELWEDEPGHSPRRMGL